MSPQIAYFFKRVYGNIIKWWFVVYNPIARRIWPTKKEEEIALEHEKEAEEAEKEELEDVAQTISQNYDEPDLEATEEPLEEILPEEDFSEELHNDEPQVIIDDDNYNATTGAYSGLYGKGALDEEEQTKYDEIMKRNADAHSIDSFIPSYHADDPDTDSVPTPSDQDDVLREANAIYERLLREAAQDETAKQAEIEAIKAAQL